MNIIDIDKTAVPYTFNINLSNRIYTFNINYNVVFDFFTVDLLLDKIVLVKNEKLMLNQFLFKEVAEDKDHNINPNFPNELFFIGSTDNSIKRIGYDSLGSTVFLYVADRSEIL